MAIRQILKLGERQLREISKEVTVFDERLFVLLDDMKETMLAANGVGLAAPQVGVLKRAVVVCVDGETFYELINPRIVRQSGVQRNAEGCLSVPDRRADVERPKKVVVAALDRHGKPFTVRGSDYLAVAFCHEIDHLNGVLFIDKAADTGK
ncbi:MAG: peptide deformylase [Clostridiales bacterium]|jgi:peptide deformylase|nr:peptide deformylase [Clostridiales bacterium]